jgi:hypothetical protein
MADETETPTPTGEEQASVPSAPSIDPSDYERLKAFHETYSGYVAASEPYANTINKVIADPEFRNLVDSASRAREALAPADDTPAWARKTLEDVEAVRKDLDAEKTQRQQQAAIAAAQNRILALAQSYPAIAENDYKIANQIAEKLKSKNITMDQFVDTLEAIAPELSKPVEAPKTPPRSTRADAGVPAVSKVETQTFTTNKGRGEAILKSLRKSLESAK